VQIRPNEPDPTSHVYIVYQSRAQRNRINKKVMADPRLDMDGESMPFDAKRMIFGRFEDIVRL